MGFIHARNSHFFEYSFRLQILLGHFCLTFYSGRGRPSQVLGSIVFCVSRWGPRVRLRIYLGGSREALRAETHDEEYDESERGVVKH